MGIVREADGRLEQAPLTLDPHVVGAVDHDLRDAVVREQALEGAVAEDVVRDLGYETITVVARDAGFPREVIRQIFDDLLSQPHGIHVDVEELRTELADHGHVDAVLDLGEGIPTGRGCGRTKRGEAFVELHQCFLPPRILGRPFFRPFGLPLTLPFTRPFDPGWR